MAKSTPVDKLSQQAFDDLCQMAEPLSAQLHEAFDVVRRVHWGKRQRDGSAFLLHPIRTAQIVAEWGIYADLILAALLHHVFDRQSVGSECSPSNLRAHFNSDVVAIAEETSRLSYARQASQKAGSYEELAHLLGNIKDVRVTIVKVASGLEMARGLQSATSTTADRTLAQFLLNTYALLAGRLGMWNVKREIEGRCLAVLLPDTYRTIKQVQDELILGKAKLIERIATELTQKCQSLNIDAQILTVVRGEYGRFRHLQARQMLDDGLVAARRYLELGDVIRFVILTTSKDDCYRIIGLVHEMACPVGQTFRDYISLPKPNGYSSIDTTVKYSPDDGVNHLYVSVRTHEMNTVANLGICAEVAYRFYCQTAHLAEPSSDLADHRLEFLPPTFVRKLIESLVRPSTKPEQVAVFTPHGETKYLLSGATPLDFAYKIHSQVGNHYAFAKVNGKDEDIRYRLQDGDVVEIVTQQSMGLEPAWLEIAATPHAKSKIRHHLKQLPIFRGQTLLLRELKRRKLDWADYQTQSRLKELARAKWGSIEHLWEEVGRGRESADMVVDRLTMYELPGATVLGFQVSTHEAEMMGLLHPMPRRAKCCTPDHGDSLIGCVRDGSIVVHKARCGIAQRADRHIAVTWAPKVVEPVKRIELKLEGYDRAGLVLDVATVVTRHYSLNMSEFHAENTRVGHARIRLVLEVIGKVSDRLLSELSSIDGIANIITDEDIPLASIFSMDSQKSSVTHSGRIQSTYILPNPYSPGRPIKKREMFFGRQNECEKILGFLRPSQQPTCVLLAAERRTGKTSLAWSVATDFSIQPEYIPVYIDLASHSNATDDEFLRYIGRMIRHEVKKLGWEFKTPTWQGQDGALLQFEESLDELFRATGKQLLLILDEFDAVVQSFSVGRLSIRVFQSLRSWAQMKPVTLFVVGLSTLPLQIAQLIPDFANIFVVDQLGPLGEAENRRLIVQPALPYIEYEPVVVDEIVRMTANHPYYTHLICAKLFARVTDGHRSVVTNKDMSQVLESFTDGGSMGYFAHLWDRGIPSHKGVLAQIVALSQEDTPWVRLDRLCSALHESNGLIATSAEDLRNMGTLEHRVVEGMHEYRVRLPLFALWVRDNWGTQLAF